MDRSGVFAGSATTASLTFASTASAQLDEVNTKQLRDAVTVDGILQHERALQTIVSLNGGTRASGMPGYEASLNYVKGRLDRRLHDRGPAVHVPVLR